MNCERIVKASVRFYNALLKHNHFPSSSLDLLDAMIEKGKENKTNKLTVIQAIEVDLQLLMRMFSGMRIE